MDAVRRGVCPIAHSWPGYDIDIYPVSCLIGGFAGSPNSEVMIHWMYQSDGYKLWQEFRKDKFNVVAFPGGLRPTEVFAHSHKPIRNLEDLKGIKFRTVGAWADILPKLGASVVSLPGGEVLSALERKVIDATEWATPGENLPMGFHEVAKYIIIPGVHQPSAPFEYVYSQIVLNMTEFQAQVLPAAFYAALPAPFNLGTYVWGYWPSGQADRSTYLGPIILAARHTPVEMMFVNNLGSAETTKVDAYKCGTDQNLHWADPLNGEANMWNHMAHFPAPTDEGAKNYDGPVPACVHLHGGEVPPVLDGGPDAWVTSDGLYKGHAFYSADGASATNYHIYRYPNSPEASPIWFHDHTLGATRLNVYCGLAGGYLVLDQANDPTNLPEGPIPLIIQDRTFDANGQLFFPSDTAPICNGRPIPSTPTGCLSLSPLHHRRGSLSRTGRWIRPITK